jgi:hypothetical protein
VWIGLTLISFSGTLFWQALSYDYYSKIGPGPGLLPIWMSGSLLLLSVAYMIESVRKDPIDILSILPHGKGLKKVLALFGALALFLAMVNFSGYIIASSVMLFILFSFDYKWYWASSISVAVTLAVFYVFKTLLNVPLPKNYLGF